MFLSVQKFLKKSIKKQNLIKIRFLLESKTIHKRPRAERVSIATQREDQFTVIKSEELVATVLAFEPHLKAGLKSKRTKVYGK